MGLSVGGPDPDDAGELHEINVTPFIDVMLVLLIIFMVAAPLSTVDVPVDLPGTTATPGTPPEDPLYLTLQKDLSLVLDSSPVPSKGLAAALDTRTEGQRDRRIFLRADRSVDYGALMQLMGDLRAAGYLKVALVGLEGSPP
jgi:biopolymer transport protein ExbD